MVCCWSVQTVAMTLPSVDKAERRLESAIRKRGKIVRSTKTLYTIYISAMSKCMCSHSYCTPDCRCSRGTSAVQSREDSRLNWADESHGSPGTSGLYSISDFSNPGSRNAIRADCSVRELVLKTGSAIDQTYSTSIRLT